MLKGRKPAHGHGFKKGFDSRRRLFNNEDRKSAVAAAKAKIINKYTTASWEELGSVHRRRKIIEEQNGKCLWCGLKEWRGKPLVFEIDHIDGNKKNNSRNNLRALCPNCHSQTLTWRKKNK